MLYTPVSSAGSHHWPLRRLGDWLTDAWRLFRGAPIRLYALAVLPMLVEIVLQVGVPRAGVVLSKLVVPVFSAWALLMAHGVITRQRADAADALRALWRIRRSLPGLVLLSAAVFAFQWLVLLLLAGPAGAMALIAPEPANLTSLTRLDGAISIASGAIPAVALLFFAGSRIVLDGVPVFTAIGENLRLLRRNPAPLLGWMTANVGLLLGLAYQPWILPLLLPLGLVAYAAWRDVFGATDATTGVRRD
ncbi:MAG: hypothetical protein ACTIJY_02555 [Luteimonas sp.]